MPAPERPERGDNLAALGVGLTREVSAERPPPIFQPSSTANIVSVTQRSPNHTSTMSHLWSDGDRFRTMQNFAPDEIQVQEAEDEIQSSDSNQREQDVSELTMSL